MNLPCRQCALWKRSALFTVLTCATLQGCEKSGPPPARAAGVSTMQAGQAVGPTFIVLPSIYEHPLKIGDAALIAEASRIQTVEAESLIITSWSEADYIRASDDERMRWHEGMKSSGGLSSTCKAMSVCAVDQRMQGSVETADMLQAAIQRIIDVNMAKEPPPTKLVEMFMDSVQKLADAAGGIAGEGSDSEGSDSEGNASETKPDPVTPESG